MEYYDNNNDYHKSPHESQPDSDNHLPRKKPDGMAVASLLCGLSGTMFLCSCFAFPACILLGVAAVCLSIMSKHGKPFSGYAIAGLILGIISAVLGVAQCAYLLLISSMVRDPQFAPIFDEIMMQYETILQQGQ